MSMSEQVARNIAYMNRVFCCGDTTDWKKIKRLADEQNEQDASTFTFRGDSGTVRTPPVTSVTDED